MRYFIKTAGSEQTGYEVKGNKVYKVTYTSQPGMEMQEIREEVKDFQDKETIKRMLKAPDMVKFKKLSEYKMYYNEQAAEIFKGAKKKCKKKKGMAKKANASNVKRLAKVTTELNKTKLSNPDRLERLIGLRDRLEQRILKSVNPKVDEMVDVSRQAAEAEKQIKQVSKYGFPPSIN